MESVSRISSVLGTTHNLTIDAAVQLGAIRRTSRNPPIRNAQIKKLLDSRHEREVIEGLRQVITLSHRPPIPDDPLLFSSVLKNIASPSIHVKKLVYVHLLQYAENDPDTALLSINTIQKTLSHSDPHLRALALRVMASIRVPVISQIVLLAIKKGAGDMSPLVRKAAALAIPKCARLDPATIPQLEDFLSTLLGDRQYYVAGAAVTAFMELFGWSRIDMIHKHYKSLVRKMVDMDEWSQIATLRLMVGYGRKSFPQRWKRAKNTPATSTSTADFYDDSEPVASAPNPSTTLNHDQTPILDPDLTLLLNAALPLLQSRNSAVIIATTRLYLALAPQATTYLTHSIGPLIALLRTSPSIRQTALTNTLQIALHYPALFVRYTTHFLLRSTDSPQTWRLKLELLTLIFPHAPFHTQSLILTELSHFSNSTNLSLVRDCVRALGRCAQTSAPSSKISSRCLRLLTTHLSNPSSPSLVAESLTVIRHLIQADPSSHMTTVTRLAKNLDTMTNSSARASIIWLVGEYAGVNGGDNIAADVLRILAKGFAEEGEQAKLQVLLLGARVYLHYLNGENGRVRAELEEDGHGNEGSSENDMRARTPNANHPIPHLFAYLLLLARYDTSYDLRDRARFYKSLLSNPSSTGLASLLLLAPKPAPAVPSPSAGSRGFMLGSASLVVGMEGAGSLGGGGLRGYEGVPEWVEEGREPDGRLRGENDGDGRSAIGGSGAYDSREAAAADILDAVGGISTISSGGRGRGVGGMPVGEKTLDDWLEEEEEEEEEEEDSEGSEESEGSESEDSEEEGSDGEEGNDDEEEDEDKDSDSGDGEVRDEEDEAATSEKARLVQ